MGHGWSTDSEGNITVEWMKGPPAPMAVLELMSCQCRRKCQLPDCTCLAYKLKCTEMCRLQTCENQRQDDEDEVVAELDNSDDDNDDEDE